MTEYFFIYKLGYLFIFSVISFKVYPPPILSPHPLGVGLRVGLDVRLSISLGGSIGSSISEDLDGSIDVTLSVGRYRYKKHNGSLF